MTSTTSDKWSTMSRTVFLAFGFVIATLIIYEHRIHVLGFLPYLFLSTCVLMHLFMHHGQGGTTDIGVPAKATTQKPTEGRIMHDTKASNEN